MKDAIIIEGLRVFAYHGVNSEERRKGQPFELDITLYAGLSKAAVSDDLKDTVNYAEAVRIASAAMLEQPFMLIESAAAYVADRLLARFELLSGVTVTLKKPRAPIAADFKQVAVRITRRRQERGDE